MRGNDERNRREGCKKHGKRWEDDKKKKSQSRRLVQEGRTSVLYPVEVGLDPDTFYDKGRMG